MSRYEREDRERRKRERVAADRRTWLNGQLRHAIACSHQSSAENDRERLHYIMGALSACAGLDLDELSRLLRGEPAPKVNVIVGDPL